MLPSTSVIMVSYRTGPILFRAIESVLQQTALTELILVDNGNSPEIVGQLQALAQNNQHFHLITGHGNIGFGRACNLGALQASGEYLLFMNPDSVLKPDIVEKFVMHAQKLQRPFMIGPLILGSDGKEQRACRRELLTPMTAFSEVFGIGSKKLNLIHQPLPRAITPVPAISGACMFMPATDFVQVDGFDQDYFLHVEDLDICYRFNDMGGKIWFAPDITVFHEGHTSDVPSRFVEWCKTKSFMLYFHKNFGDRHHIFSLWLFDIAIFARFAAKMTFSCVKQLQASRAQGPQAKTTA